MSKVNDLRIDALGFNLDIEPFREHRAAISALLPTKLNQRVRFILANSDTSIANAIRRVGISELKVRAFNFDISEIRTNDKEIVLADLHDRIGLIPIDQDIPLDAVFSLSLIHDTIEQELLIGYSRNLVQIAGKPIKGQVFSNTHRLVSLHPGTFLEIPHIHVVEGYCYHENGAKFSNTAEFKYQVRDYLDVDFLNERGNIITKVVRRADLVKLLRTQGIKNTIEQHLSSASGLYNRINKILVIPNKDYQNELDKKTRARVGKYEIILENTATPVASQTSEFLRAWSSAEVSPAEFFIEITLHGTIDPEIFLQNICDNVIERLTILQNFDNLVMRADEHKTTFMIRNENYTIPCLITRRIFTLDPSIGLVNSTLEHPQIRAASINVIHSEPAKIFQDAIASLIAEFTNLKKQFTGANRSAKPIYLTNGSG